MERHGATIDRQSIADFCRRNHIRRFAFFGSFLTDAFGPESDIDVLVDFDPGREPGFFGLADMEFELSEMLGRKVHLQTPEDLSQYFREKVVRTAEVLYAA